MVKATWHDRLQTAWRWLILNTAGLGGLALLGRGLYLWWPPACWMVLGALLIAGAVAGVLRSPPARSEGP